MSSVLHDYWAYFLVGQYPNGPLGGLALTLLLGVSAVTLALPFGVLLGLARLSPWRALRWPVMALVYVVRGSPLLMVVFWAYFFMPGSSGRGNSQFATMLAALVVFNGAYLAEIVRSGLEALPRGQLEAARSLGLGYLQAMRHVVLPQALRNVLPSLVSQLVVTIKETSLGYIIGLTEFTFIATQVDSQLITHSTAVYTLVALTYFALCGGLSLLARRLDARSGPQAGPRPGGWAQARRAVPA